MANDSVYVDANMELSFDFNEDISTSIQVNYDTDEIISEIKDQIHYAFDAQGIAAYILDNKELRSKVLGVVARKLVQSLTKEQDDSVEVLQDSE